MKRPLQLRCLGDDPQRMGAVQEIAIAKSYLFFPGENEASEMGGKPRLCRVGLTLGRVHVRKPAEDLCVLHGWW